mgnify:CR=1 FL=1
MADEAPLLLVSTHLPKTAGVSFFSALKQHFPSGLRRDYEDVPINTPLRERITAAFRHGAASVGEEFAGVRCIHGHFLPVKYLPMATMRGNVEFITWMRNPVDRLVSHYRYWKRNFDPGKSQAFHRQVVEEDWSLEKFCLSPRMRNLYGQFLYAFPLEYFRFIGITEHYEEDLAAFSQHYFGGPAVAERLNVAPSGDRARIDPGLVRDIEQFHADDMALYERALAFRARRVAGGRA